MTFSDISNLACATVGEQDTDSVTYANNICVNRYRVLWNAYDWPETKQRVQYSILASQANLFTDSIYGELIGASWTPDPAHLAPSPSDYREIGWIEKNTSAIILNTGAIVPAYYWQDQTMGLPNAAITSIQFQVFNGSGESATIIIHGVVLDASSGQTVEITETLTISQSGAGSVVPVNNFKQVFSLSRSAGISRIGVKINGSSTYNFVMPANQQEFRFAQYRFFPVPQSAWTWILTHKIRCPDQNAVNINDSPAIKHLEDALIAYTQAGMLERQRQYSKAQAKTQEAAMFVDGAKKIIREQSQFFQQITPETYDLTNLRGGGIWRPTTSFF